MISHTALINGTFLFIPCTVKDCCRNSLECTSRQVWQCLNLIFVLTSLQKIKLLMSDLAIIFFILSLIYGLLILHCKWEAIIAPKL